MLRMRDEGGMAGSAQDSGSDRAQKAIRSALYRIFGSQGLLPEAESGWAEAGRGAYTNPSVGTTSMGGAGGGAGGGGASAARKRALKLLQQTQAQRQQQISGGYEQLLNSLQQAQNPYANFQQQTTQVAPELQQLLQSQGAPTDPLAQFAAAMQSADTGRQNAFSDMMNQLSGIWQATQGQRAADIRAQQNIDLQELANQAAMQRLALRMGGR